MDWNFNTSEKITYCLLSVLQKKLICLFKLLQTAMHSGKIDIHHIFCYGELSTVPGLAISFLSFESNIYEVYLL